MSQKFGRLQHASSSALARCQVSFRRSSHVRATPGQFDQVFLRGRVGIHVALHGGSEQQGTLRRQDRDGQQRIGLTVRQLGQRISRAGRNH